MDLGERIKRLLYMFYTGSDPNKPIPEPPPMGTIPFRASPGRSFARAINHPFSEEPGLEGVTVRDDRPEATSPLWRKLAEMGTVDTSKLSTLDPDTLGEYRPKSKVATIGRVGPRVPDKQKLLETYGHELTHPAQRNSERNNGKLQEAWLRVPWTARHGRDSTNRGLGPVVPRLPDNHYESPLSFWVGRYVAGESVPPEVEEFIKQWVSK